MNKVTCSKGVWVEAFTGVTTASFSLINDYPEITQGRVYKIHWGNSLPAVDTDVYNLYELDRDPDNVVYAMPIQFTNSTATNVYVMCVTDDGAITY